MCGIVGVYQDKEIDPAILEKMTDILAHRGPDDRGVFIDNNIGLGHRRLAILDLSPLGHQPMSYDLGNYQIVFNGEIYNFPAVKKVLLDKGYKFQSKSDTEVILAAYKEWGESCVEQFNGMWAFVLYDRAQKKFFASRDRLGIKPLYYYFKSHKLVLASEIKSFLHDPDFEVKIDLAALNEYFTFQNILSSKTLFQDVKILPPGCNLIYSGEELEIKPWWQIPLAKKELKAEDWQEKILETAKQAIKRHLVSDVEVGSYLSGGMDSASIVALASQENNRLKTFTAGFDLSSAEGLEAAFDERQEARMAAKLYGTDHHEVLIHSGSMKELMPELIWHLEDLRVGMCYPNYIVSALASRFVKVVLSGAAGDELFGGYVWRYEAAEKTKTKEEFNQTYYRFWSRLVSDADKKNFFSHQVLEQIDLNQPLEEFRRVLEPVDSLPPAEKALYFDLKTFLHGLFVVEDKVAMAHSIEVRVPFTDLEMIELACSIPVELKYRDGLGKVVLRQAMAGILPEKLVNKPKQGFSPPEGSWYRDESLPYVKSILLDPTTLGRGFFQPAYIKKIIQEHVSGKVNHRLLIWSLLSFEWWCRIFLDGQWEQYDKKTANSSRAN